MQALDKIYLDNEIVADELNSLKLENIIKQRGRFNTISTLLAEYRVLLYVVLMMSFLYAITGGTVFYAFYPVLLQRFVHRNIPQ